MTDFYEQDEPVEDVIAAFDRATERGVTGQDITDAINADPAEVERLRAARRSVRSRRRLAGFSCRHYSITAGPLGLSEVTCACGCVMEPFYATTTTA